MNHVLVTIGFQVGAILSAYIHQSMNHVLVTIELQVGAIQHIYMNRRTTSWSPLNFSLFKLASRRPSKRSAANEPPAYQTVLPNTSLTKKIAEEDSEDNGPSKESRSRSQKTRTFSSRHGHDKYDSEESLAGDRRGGKEKTTAQSSRGDDTRRRHHDDDHDRYGRSRRDNGNRARDRSRSRNKATAKSSRSDDTRTRHHDDDNDRYGRSRRDNGNRARDRSESRHRAATKALTVYGESSRALTRRDSRSKTDAKGKGRRRAKHDDSDDEEDEVIRITRYIAADFDQVLPHDVEELCELLDVRASKVKRWCERNLIRFDNTTGLLDLRRLVSELDEEDAKKLKRYMKKLEDERKAGQIYGARSQRSGQDHSHYHQDHSHRGHDPFPHHYDRSRHDHGHIHDRSRHDHGHTHDHFHHDHHHCHHVHDPFYDIHPDSAWKYRDSDDDDRADSPPAWQHW
ncbi:hypothetical protein MMC22_008927 [Lobaria immixta]|nr:hypothetical protein [Lobaria immixta]